MASSAKYALDSLTKSATLAVSTRKLSSSYNGPLINVRRSSDNVQRDIYYDSLGNLDTYDLLNFVGAGSGYVTTFYDQSGLKNNFTQGTAARQPLVVISGSLVVNAGKPSLRFNLAPFMSLTYAFTQPGYASVVATFNSLVTSGGHLIDGLTSTARWLLGTGVTQVFQMYAGSTITPTIPYTLGVPFVLSGQFSGATSTHIVNGSIRNTGNYGTNNCGTLELGCGDGTNGSGRTYSDSFISELVIVSEIVSYSSRSSIEQSQEQYYGIAGV